MTRSDGSNDPTLTPQEAGRTTVPGTQGEAAARSRASLSIPGYELGSSIGRGGMGEVVAAHDPRIGREVAIKTLRGAASPELVDRFLREAKIQGRLDHPAIVPVHEIGHDAQGQPYFTMKRLRGETLQDVLVAGAPLQRLLRAFADACLAVQFAHDLRVVHRDLKPSNLMLGPYGEVYVLDWGIARSIGDDARPGAARDMTTLDGQTQAGALLGTPRFRLWRRTGHPAPDQGKCPRRRRKACAGNQEAEACARRDMTRPVGAGEAPKGAGEGGGAQDGAGDDQQGRSAAGCPLP